MGSIIGGKNVSNYHDSYLGISYQLPRNYFQGTPILWKAYNKWKELCMEWIPIKKRQIPWLVW